MSKKYSLKIYNNNKYGMIINSYKVYDGENNLISSGTNVSVNANSNVVLGTQTLADTDTCCWGGSEAKYTSVGAPIEVSDTLTRSDYKLYTLLATSTTTTYGLNNYSIALNLNFTSIASAGAKTFEISNTSDFVVKKTLAITLSGTSYNYTATLTQSDFTGVLSSGLTNILYLRDITNETPILFFITNTVNYFKLASPTISGVDNGSAYEYTVTNPNAYACSVFASNSSSNYVNKGTINANGTLTFTSNSNGIYVYLGGDYFTNSEVVSYAITYFNLTLHLLEVSTTGENGTYVSKSFTSYTEQYQSIDELYANGMSDWLAQSSYTGYTINDDSSSIFLNTGANYFMDIYIYSNGTLTAPTFSGNIGITKNSTTYTLTASITNPNNVSCKLFTRSTNSTFTSQTILPNETLTITKNELVSSGSNGYIYAYLTSDNYINSSTSQKAWADTLSAPIISIVSIVKNGVVYNVNINVENNNATSCDFYGNAQSSSTGTPQNLLGSISANSQQQFTITTSLNVGYVIGQLKATNYNNSLVSSTPYSYVVVPTTTSVPVSVTMEDDGQGGWRSQVVITNNTTYTLSGTLTDFTINVGTEISSVALSSMAPNTTQTKYGNVAHTSAESGQLWNLTLNLTDGITNWTLNYEGTLA